MPFWAPLTYLDAYARFGTPPIVKSKTKDDQQFFYSVIVTGADQPIDNVNQFIGKKMAFASLWSTSGNLIPRYMLAWEGLHLDKLQTYHNFNYHDTVVKKVLSNEFDAGGVRKSVAALIINELIYENGLVEKGGQTPIASLAEITAEAERAHIEQILRITGGNRTRAADLLGISRKTLWEKMNAHHLDV